MMRIYFQKILVIILFVLFCTGCGNSSYEAPYIIYRANDFDPKSIVEIEKFIRDLAIKWNFSLVEKDKDQMKYLSSGVDAFYIFLLDKDSQDDAIVTIGNAGVGTVLDFSIYDNGEKSKSSLDQLANIIKSYLETNHQLIFCEIDAKKSVCK